MIVIMIGTMCTILDIEMRAQASGEIDFLNY